MITPSVVLLPGLLSNHSLFENQLNRLSSKVDVHVITLTDVNSPEAMTQKILNIAPENFMLAGHSLGAWVVLRLMKIAPQRVNKLLLLNTGIKEITPKELAARQLILERIEKGEFPQIAYEIAQKFTFNQLARPKVLKMFLQVGAQALINQTKAMMLRENLQEILSPISCPTWVIHSEEDLRFSLDDVKEISTSIPHAVLKIIPQCGHMSPMECPEMISLLIEQWINN